MSRLAARVLTGTTLALAAVGLLWLIGCFPGGRVSRALAMAIAALAVWEVTRMGRLRGGGIAPSLWCAAFAVAAEDFEFAGETLPYSAPQQLGILCGRALGAAIIVRVVSRLVRRPGGLPNADLWSVFLALWLLPPLFSLALVDQHFGVEGLAVLVVLAKIGDNAGYFVGRAIGQRHPFPTISPGKTVAGCVASLLAGVATGSILLPLTLGERTWGHAALGALVGGALNVAAQAGDLSESWVKRRAGVKDSSALLGPSGGVLDVVDSLFFASPVALLLWAWVYAG